MSAEASVGEIAGRLSIGSARALAEAEIVDGEMRVRIYRSTPRSDGVRYRTPLSTIRALQARHLVGPYPYRLTPLGLKIKAHLNRPDAEKEMK